MGSVLFDYTQRDEAGRFRLGHGLHEVGRREFLVSDREITRGPSGFLPPQAYGEQDDRGERPEEDCRASIHFHGTHLLMMWCADPQFGPATPTSSKSLVRTHSRG